MKILDGLEKAQLPVLASLLGLLTVLVFLQVCLRYFFNASFLWAEEVSLFSFIWICFLGASIAVHRRTHFAFDMVADLFRGRLRAAQRLLVDLCMLAFAAVMIWQGSAFTALSLKRFSPAVGISLVWPTLVIPLSGALMLLFLAGHISRNLRALWRGPHAP